MACNSTGYFVILKFKAPTFGSGAQWVEGLPSDLGVASSWVYPNKKGYWYEVSTCETGTYANFQRFYKIRTDGSVGPVGGIADEVLKPYWADKNSPCAQSFAGMFIDTGANDAYSTISNNTSPIMMQRYVDPVGPGNLLSGYFSDNAKCNYTPFANPGIQEGPYKWRTTCAGPGTLRQLTLLELLSNSCNSDPAQRELFCSTLKDQGGNKRVPVACGGTDANIYTYNPANVLNELSDVKAQMDEETAAIAEDIIEQNRRVIFLLALIILIIIIAVIVI